jgi:acetoin utilization deacetylase AcuC-like enzyme
LDGDTFYSPYTCAAALQAAGAACQLVEVLAAAEADYGIVACRPPGHHATAEQAMGFCLLNNVAVAARAAQALGMPRVAIIDWDVHHGNGTEAIFEDDPSVLYISTHESPQYPGTGDAGDVGGPNARGRNVNIPLSAGAGDVEYGEVFERIIVPIIEQFAPSLVLVSAGYDAHERDPLGGMTVSDAGFGQLTRQVLSRLPNHGARQVGFLLEGGYDLTALSHSVDATLSALAAPTAPPFSGRASGPWREQIDWVRDVQSEFWELSD